MKKSTKVIFFLNRSIFFDRLLVLLCTSTNLVRFVECFPSWPVGLRASFVVRSPILRSSIRQRMMDPSIDAAVREDGLFGNLYSVALEPMGNQPESTRRKGEVSGSLRFQTVLNISVSDRPMVALHRFKIWWMRPVFSHPVPPETLFLLLSDFETRQDEASSSSSNRVENLEAPSKGRYQLVLPVVLPNASGESFSSASLQGCLEGKEEQLMLHSDCPTTGLYVGFGGDPYALIQEGVHLASSVWFDDGNSPSIPPSSRALWTISRTKLGWCSWNAFYTNVTGTKIVEAVRALKEEDNIPVHWLILDDGWQHTKASGTTQEDGQQWSQRLVGLTEDPRKFKELSLKEVNDVLRSQYGIESIWVWHTLTGYWMGLDPSSFPSSTLFFPNFSPGVLDNDPTACKEASIDRGIGIPNDASDFFREYHTNYLASVCGVDGIKVDAQGVVGTLQKRKWNDRVGDETVGSSSTVQPVLGLHSALATSVEDNFCRHQKDTNLGGESPSPSIIHCMAHAPEIFFRLPTLYSRTGLPFLRAADDYYPDNPFSHGPHVVACAFNSLLFQHLAVPDWDMFTTTIEDEKILKLHVVGRCISGGPIYFSDSPQDFRRPDVMSWVCCNDGTTLPCRQTASPTVSCLFRDLLDAETISPLVLWNVNGRNKEVTNGVLGVFHLAGSGMWDYSKSTYCESSTKDLSSPVRLKVRPCDIPHFGRAEYSTTEFVAVSFFSKRVNVLPSPYSEFTMELRYLESDYVAIVPVVKVGQQIDFVVLGMDGKINGPGCVLKLDVVDDARVAAQMIGCGTCLVFFRETCASATKSELSVMVNGDPVPVNHSGEASWSHEPTSTIETVLGDLGFDAVRFHVPRINSVSEHQMLFTFATP